MDLLVNAMAGLGADVEAVDAIPAHKKLEVTYITAGI